MSFHCCPLLDSSAPSRCFSVRIISTITLHPLPLYVRDSSLDLSLMKNFRYRLRNNHCHTQTGNCVGLLLILQRINLLPHYQRQPGLSHISHSIHSSYHDGTFFVVRGAYFMGPAIGQILLVKKTINGWGKRRSENIKKLGFIKIE